MNLGVKTLGLLALLAAFGPTASAQIGDIALPGGDDSGHCVGVDSDCDYCSYNGGMNAYGWDNCDKGYSGYYWTGCAVFVVSQCASGLGGPAEDILQRLVSTETSLALLGPGTLF